MGVVKLDSVLDEIMGQRLQSLNLLPNEANQIAYNQDSLPVPNTPARARKQNMGPVPAVPVPTSSTATGVGKTTSPAFYQAICVNNVWHSVARLPVYTLHFQRSSAYPPEASAITGNLCTLMHIQRECNGVKPCIAKFLDMVDELPKKTNHWNFLIHFPLKEPFFVRVCFEGLRGPGDQMEDQNSQSLILIRVFKPPVVLQPGQLPNGFEARNFSNDSLFWFVHELFYDAFRQNIGQLTDNADSQPGVSPREIFPRTCTIMQSPLPDPQYDMEKMAPVPIPRPFAWKRSVPQLRRLLPNPIPARQ